MPAAAAPKKRATTSQKECGLHMQGNDQNYCVERYTCFIRLLAAAEDMKKVTTSPIELRAYADASKAIRKKLNEHLELCRDVLDEGVSAGE